MSLSGTGEASLVLKLSPEFDDILQLPYKIRKGIFKWQEYLIFIFPLN